MLVLDRGHPVGVITRSDALAFLAQAGAPREPCRVDERRAEGPPTEPGQGFETRAIHAGQEPDPRHGAVVTPIHLASTFAQKAVGEHQGFEYARTNNPTRASLETTLASLEGADARVSPSRAAWRQRTQCCGRLSPGDHLDHPERRIRRDVPAGRQHLRPIGHRVHARRPDRCRARSKPHGGAETRLVWVETPSNPMLHIVDIEARRRFAHERGGRCIVDNTFATPYLQQPVWLSVRTPSSTRPPSTWAGTRTWSAAWWRRATTSWPSTRASCRTRPGPCRARSTATWCSAGSRHSRCDSTASARTPRPSPRTCSAHPAVGRSLLPRARQRIRATSVASRQMRDFGAMVSFSFAVARRLPSRWPENAALHPGRVARGGRVADRAAGADDPRLGRRLRAGGRPVTHPALGRPRGRRRPVWRISTRRSPPQTHLGRERPQRTSESSHQRSPLGAGSRGMRLAANSKPMPVNRSRRGVYVVRQPRRDLQLAAVSVTVRVKHSIAGKKNRSALSHVQGMKVLKSKRNSVTASQIPVVIAMASSTGACLAGCSPTVTTQALPTIVCGTTLNASPAGAILIDITTSRWDGTVLRDASVAGKVFVQVASGCERSECRSLRRTRSKSLRPRGRPMADSPPSSSRQFATSVRRSLHDSITEWSADS